ncbi:MAG: hypothetical protein ACUVWO_03020 [Thermodesulfobacteriota bacterium]
MEKRGKLDRESFRSVARLAGLEASDSHLEELYSYVEKLFPNFKVAGGMDLAEIEPLAILPLSKE